MKHPGHYGKTVLDVKSKTADSLSRDLGGGGGFTRSQWVQSSVHVGKMYNTALGNDQD